MRTGMIRGMSLAAVSLLALALVACGEKAEENAAGAQTGANTESVDASVPGTPDNTQEVLDYYAANPEFFTFATPADLPGDLDWEDGSDLPDIGSPQAKKGGTYNARLQDFPRTLRLVGPDSNGGFRSFILDDVRMQFAHPHHQPGGDAYRYYPGLATEWAESKERKTVYVRLNPKARFSDGEMVTTEDVMFSFFFFRSKYIVAPWYNHFYSTEFTNVTRYDDHTFSVTFPEAKPDMKSRALTWGPLPRKFFKELGDDYVERYQWRFVPTTGPYAVHDKDIKKGRAITITRDPNWWAKDMKFWRNRFNFDKLRFTVIRDTAKSFEAFKRGDIDDFTLNLAEYWYDKLPDTDEDVASGYIEKATFYNVRPRPTYGLWVNESRPLLDNRDIRVGINLAVNFDMVIEKFFRGDAVRMKSRNDGYGIFSHPSLRARPYDIDKALAAFAKAGFDTRGDDGILVNAEGQRLSFTLTTGYESLKDVLTILREEGMKAGVEFRLEVLDGTAAWKKVQEKKHDIALTAFNVSYEEFPRYFDFLASYNSYDKAFLEDGSVNPDRKIKVQTNNLQMVADFELNKLVERYRASEDGEEKRVLAHQIDQIDHDTASFVPGWVQPFYRRGYWRWLRHPEGFNLQHSGYDVQNFVSWIDEDMKAETKAAMKKGETFPPQINVYDQFKED